MHNTVAATFTFTREGVAGSCSFLRPITPARLDCVEKHRHPVRRHRLADEVTLHGVASLFSEETELLLGFHAFGDDRHFKTVTEANDRAHDRRRLRIASKIHDKGAVDLDLVERERLQIAQRGVAAAEIVHRNSYAHLPQPMQRHQVRIVLLEGARSR